MMATNKYDRNKRSKKEFKQFLVKHHAYQRFCKNLKRHRFDEDTKLSEAFDKFGTMNSINLITMSFTFVNTPEQAEYWMALNHKWKELHKVKE